MPNNYDIMQKIYSRIVDLNVGITVKMARNLTKKALKELNNDLSNKEKNEKVIKRLIRESDLKPVELKYYLFVKEGLSEEEINDILD